MSSSPTPATERPRKFFKVSLRDLLWLVLVIGVGLGWWIDQARIVREREALKAAARRLQALSLQDAEVKLQVAEAEFASLSELKRKSTSAISLSEFRRAELRLQAAKLEVAKARASEEHGAVISTPKSQKAK